MPGEAAEGAAVVRSMGIKCVACDSPDLIEVPATSSGKRFFFAACRCGARYSVNYFNPSDEVSWPGHR